MHFDDLLDYLLTNFTEPVDPREVALYSRYGAWTVAHFEALPGRVVPLMVIRTVLSDEGVRFDPALVPSWPRFVDRYQDALRAS